MMVEQPNVGLLDARSPEAPAREKRTLLWTGNAAALQHSGSRSQRRPLRQCRERRLVILVDDDIV